MAKKQVLFVDDEPSVRDFVRKVLTRNGFECLLAEDAAQALVQMTRHRADLVVADVHMHGSDGPWLLGTLKEQWAAVPVIMLTGHHDAEVAVTCLKSGAVDYLFKPVEIPELLSAIRSALGESQLGQNISPED